jgi:hypothetical protein
MVFDFQLQRADDLGLPPRMVIVRRDYFSAEEKELYLSLFSDAKRQFSTYLDQGTVLNSACREFYCIAGTNLYFQIIPTFSACELVN